MVEILNAVGTATQVLISDTHSLRLKATTDHGLKVYEYLGAETKLYPKGSGADPAATMGILETQKGRDVFVVYATNDTAATAKSFVASFRLG